MTMDSKGAGASKQRLRMLVLGANAWFVIVGWGSVTEGTTHLQAVLAMLSAFSLVWGTWWMRRGAWGRWLLLGVFPAGVVAHAATRPEAVNQRIFDPAVSLVAVLSLVAYLAAAAHGLAGSSDTAPTGRVEPLDGGSDSPSVQNRLRQAVLLTAAVGSLTLAVLVPRLGGLARWQAHWESAAVEGGLLTAVVGVVLATAVCSSFVGNGLRAVTRTRSRRGRKARTLQLLLLAGAGALTYALLFLR